MLHFFFGFQGRVRRSHYFFAALAAGAVYCALALCGFAAMNIHIADGLDDVTGRFDPSPFAVLAGCVLTFFALWTSLALTVKRWHDVGFTGWFSVLSLPPFTHGVVFLLLCLLPGTQGPNRYGSDPRGRLAPIAPGPEGLQSGV
jgi:uncharacterized membrane protein YhaH (DUF805 family)